MNELLDLYAEADDAGVVVDCFDVRSGSISMMDEQGQCYIAIDPMRLRSNADEYVKLAHEMGHCMTGAFYNERTPLITRRKCEHKADKWAVAHVLPPSKIKAAISGGHIDPWDMADYLGVTEDFLHQAFQVYAEWEEIA